MPMRLSKIHSFNTHSRCQYQLFKKDDSNIISTQPPKREVAFKNGNLSMSTKIIIQILDKLNPFLKKHPKLAKASLNVSEKLIKFSHVVSNNNNKL